MSARPSPWSSPRRASRPIPRPKWLPSITKSCPGWPTRSKPLRPMRRVCGTNCPTTSSSTATFGDVAATDAAFARAAHVVTATYHIGRVTGVPLEPRAALGSYDAETDRYTLYAGSGGAVRQKREIAEVLNLEPEQVRVLSFDVGGNFGTRNRTYVEFGLVLWASRKLEPSGQIPRRAQRMFPHRLSGPRSRHRGVARASMRRGNSSRCARPISAMSARAACRCRRSARARGSSPATTTSRTPRCTRAPSIPTRCARRPIAARAGRK